MQPRIANHFDLTAIEDPAKTSGNLFISERVELINPIPGNSPGVHVRRGPCNSLLFEVGEAGSSEL